MIVDGSDLFGLTKEAREVASAWGEGCGSFPLFLPGLQGENGTPWPPRTKGEGLVTSAKRTFSALLKA